MSGKPEKQPKAKNLPQDSGDGTDYSLEQEIERQIGDLVPQKARSEVIRRLNTIMFSELFSGPIAHPRHLREYEAIQPGAADRIIRMAENRNDHHISMDNKLSDAEIADRRLGMISGATLFGMLVLAALIAGIWTGETALAAVFMGAVVIGGIGLFIKGRNG